MLKSRMPLLLAIGVPVVFLVGIMAVALVPTLLAKPQHDFIYFAAPDGTQFADAYSLAGGTLKRTCTVADSDDGLWQQSNGSSQFESTTLYYPYATDCEALYARFAFYRFDTTEKKSTKLTEQAVMALQLSNERISPDGYYLTRGSSAGLWWSGDNGAGYTYYLKGNGARVDIGELQTMSHRYADDIFIGWVQ